MDEPRHSAWTFADSLSVSCLRCGVTDTVLPGQVEQYPFTVVGQVLGTAVWHELEGGTAVRLPAGSGYVSRAGLRHRFSTRGKVGTFAWAHIDAHLLGGIDAFAFMGIVDAGVLGERIGAINRELVALLGDAMRGTSRRGDSLRMVAEEKRLCFGLFSALLECAVPPAEATELVRGGSRLAPVLRLMSERFSQRLGIPGLARAAGLSPSRFHAVFAATFGRSPSAYLQDLRVRAAQRLLIAEDAPISEVAARCGFGDQFHFSRQFRRHCGTSPSAYRHSGRASLARLTGE